MTTDAAVDREGLIARHPLVFFFILAFVFSWGYWGLFWVLQLEGTGFMYTLAAAGPTVSAFVILALTSGKPGVLRLLRSYVHWRVGVQWYLVSVIGVSVLMFLCFVVVPGALADFVAPGWSFVPLFLIGFASTLFIPSGPLLEEGGWRGFALPRLQRLHGPLVGTLILGVLWALWHLVLFFGPLAIQPPDATFVSLGLAFVLFTIGLTGASVVITWVFNNTGGSVLMAILIHASFDNAGVFLTIFPSSPTEYIPVSFQGMGQAVVWGTAALTIIVFTRGRLGYDHYLQEAEEEPDLAPARA